MKEYRNALQALETVATGLSELLTKESRDLLNGSLDYSGLIIRISGDIVQTVYSISDYIVGAQSRAAFIRESIQFAACNRF